MKVIVIGGKKATQGLVALLARQEIETVAAGEELKQMLSTPEPQGYDLAIIDGQMEGLETTCRHINELWAIPTVVMATSEQADWSRLQEIPASGFLTGWAGDSELMARLRAIIQRFRLKEPKFSKVAGISSIRPFSEIKNADPAQRLSLSSEPRLMVGKNYAYNRFQYIKQKMREGSINDEDC